MWLIFAVEHVTTKSMYIVKTSLSLKRVAVEIWTPHLSLEEVFKPKRKVSIHWTPNG